MRFTILVAATIASPLLVGASSVLAQHTGVIDLADVGDTIDGAIFEGESAGDQAGRSIFGSFDTDGDGDPDILIGAHTADGAEGKVYLVYSASHSGDIDLGNVGSFSLPGVIFTGETDEIGFAGFSVSGGNFDGDAYDDVLIGAFLFDIDGVTGSREGRSYIWLGTNSASSTVDLADADATFEGIQSLAESGRSVSTAGDLDNDGEDDLLIGSPFFDGIIKGDIGETYLFYGSDAAGYFDGSIDLSDADARILGADASDVSAWSVAGVGDVNADGYDDLVIGVPGRIGVSDCKGAYLLYGGAGDDKIVGGINLSNVGGSVAGAYFECVDADGLTGVSVSAAGDVNDDGAADFLIGAPGVDSATEDNIGRVYLVYGAEGVNAHTGTIDLDTIEGSLGVTFDGENEDDQAGISISSAGDINDDGYDDILIGANRFNSVAGRVYLIYGNLSTTTTNLDLADVGGGISGAKFDGEAAGDGAGISVAAAGDVDADGVDDLLIGAWTADVGANADAGKVYLIYGIAPGGATYDGDPMRLEDFYDLFAVGDIAADLNQDGVVDQEDFFTFVESMSARRSGR